MRTVEQGDLLKIEGIVHPVMVVSNNFFNQSGRAIVCPVIKKAVPGPLHIEVQSAAEEGFVLCEQVRYIDLSARRFVKLSEAHYYDVMDIADAVAGMFEYQ